MFHIPPQVKIKNFQEIPSVVNSFIIGLIVTIHIFTFFIYPLHPSLCPFALTAFLFLLITFHTAGMLHEAIHGTLLKNRFLNTFFGRILCILIGFSYEKVKEGHILHHQKNREKDYCSEIIVNPKSKTLAIINYYYTEFFGIHFNELMFVFLSSISPKSLLSKIMFFKTYINNLKNKKSYKKIQLDSRITVIIYTTSFFCYGNQYSYLLYLMVMRSFLFSLSAGLGHYKTPLYQTYFAYNLKLNYIVDKFILLNFNYHGIHHAYPTLPWIKLPEKQQNLSGKDVLNHFHISYWKALLSKFHPPVIIEKFPEKKGDYND